MLVQGMRRVCTLLEVAGIHYNHGLRLHSRLIAGKVRMLVQGILSRNAGEAPAAPPRAQGGARAHRD